VVAHAEHVDERPCLPRTAHEEGWSEAPLAVSVWRRMNDLAAPAPGQGVARRWGRLLGKLLAVKFAVLPAENGNPTSVGSASHAIGRPCRPCRFFKRGRGCYDGVLCKGCHFTCGHIEAPKETKASSSAQQSMAKTAGRKRM